MALLRTEGRPTRPAAPTFRTSPYELTELARDEPEYAAVMRLPGMPSRPGHLSVARVTNAALRARFDAYIASTMEARNADSVDAVVAHTMFHGTTVAALPSILGGGFDPARNAPRHSAGRFG
jgi:hypothetical protein